MMFSFSPSQQVIVFFESMGFGALSALGYVLIDALVGAFADGKKKTVICDIIWSVSASVAFFVFLLSYNLGKFRFYIALGTVLGFVATLISFGTYIRRFFDRIIATPRKMILFVVRKFENICLRTVRRLKSTFNKAKSKQKERKNMKKKFKKTPESIAKRNNDVV